MDAIETRITLPGAAAGAGAATARAGGIRLAYDVAGAGRPLVLVGGFNTARPFWNALRPHLGDRRLVAFDPRDVGASGLARAPYDARRLARDTLAVMDAAGVARADVIGHSLGGAAAQELAVLAPARVRRLVLANAAARAGPRIRRIARLLGALRRRLGDRAFAGTLHAVCLSQFFLMQVPVAQALERLRAAQPPQPAAAAMRQIGALDRFDARDRVGAIACPTLVVASPRDGFFAEAETAALAAAIPQSELARIGAGHCPMLEAAPAFGARVRAFLDT